MLASQLAAATVVADVLAGKSLVPALIHMRQTGHLTAQQQAACQDLSYGVLRIYGELAAILAHLAPQTPKSARLRALLLVALYQLQEGRHAPYTVVNFAVKAAEKLKQAKGFVNAVLRRFTREQAVLCQQVREHNEVARYNYPKWWIKQVRQSYPQTWEQVLAQGNTHPPLTLRIHPQHTTACAYVALLAEQGMPAYVLSSSAVQLEKPVPVDKLPHFWEGWVSVQDFGAQAAAAYLAPAAGMRVLDACAAPGGKSGHLLESYPQIQLTALDIDPVRVGSIEQNFKRLQLQAHVVVGDAADPTTWWNGEPFARILADVPCSGSGVVRRHPDSKWLRRAADIAQLTEQQQRILQSLWSCLAPQGRLLYVTCSIFPAENQQQIAAFLATHPEASCLEQVQWLPEPKHDGFYYALLQKN